MNKMGAQLLNTRNKCQKWLVEPIISLFHENAHCEKWSVLVYFCTLVGYLQRQ